MSLSGIGYFRVTVCLVFKTSPGAKLFAQQWVWFAWNKTVEWTPIQMNRPFPSSLVPLFQGESKYETILMKMTLICMKMKLHAELIFIWKVSHLPRFETEAQENSEMAHCFSRPRFDAEAKFNSEIAFCFARSWHSLLRLFATFWGHCYAKTFRHRQRYLINAILDFAKQSWKF